MSFTLVGILNVTPDSFSDSGAFLDPGVALVQAKQLMSDGATKVDIGAEATNPWAEPIESSEEWRRLEPIIRGLLPAYPEFSFSIDTRHPDVVERAAALGKFYVNDVTTFIDEDMIKVTASHQLRAIASHLPLAAGGDFVSAHRDIKMDSAEKVRDELLLRKAAMIKGGIAADGIILDPGIGFGKSMRLNWQLLEFAKLVPGEAVMIGFSRKRFLACDPATGEPISGADKLDPVLNQKAARIAAAASEAVWLQVHEPKLYRELI